MRSAQEFDGPRLIRQEELAASRQLSMQCFGHSFDEHEATVNETSAPPEEIHVIACCGKPVSQIHTFHIQLDIPGGLIHIGSIGGVCTHPEFRGLGLATRLLEHCAQQLRQGGANLMLISGDRGLYTRAGCALAGKFADFTLRPGLRTPLDRPIHLRRPLPEDALWCSQTYQAEPVHFRRSPDRFRDHFSRPVYAAAGEEWIIEVDGQPAAYLLLRLPWEYVGRAEAGVRKVHEYAGDRAAIAGAIALAFEQHGLRSLQFSVPWQDREMIRLLEECGGRFVWTPLPEHTMRILNFPAMMEDIQPYLQARLAAPARGALRFAQTGPLMPDGEQDLYTISLGPERLELDGAAMTRLVMDSPSALPQVDAHGAGALREALAALFPLPAFLPGLDYH